MSISRIDSELCNGCGLCVDVCPQDVIRLDTAPQGRDELPPCTMACPAGVDMRSYIPLIEVGMLDEAIDVLKESLPFPAVTGRVCPHPCESGCARTDVDQAVNINGLERYLGDYCLEKKAEAVRKIYSGKAAIIGSGPAGLACAYFLCRMGYPVTVFESMPVLGGMLRMGIPEYRLPRNILDVQIEYIRDMGVEFKTGITVGKDVSLDELRREYQAVFFAAGNQLSSDLQLEGSELEGVLLGLDFLRDVNLNKDVKVGEKIVVVGGGNVAVNVAVTALRLGAKDVQIVCLEQEEDMPAFEEEVRQALEEGVKVATSLGPKRLLGDGGRVAGVELMRCVCVFDENGAFNPSYAEGADAVLEADQVILAVGQKPDLSLFSTGPKSAQGGTVEVDAVTLQTSVPGVFAGGDVVLGASTVVEAIAAGKRASVSIDRHIKGQDLRSGRTAIVGRVRKPPKDGIAQWARQAMALLPVDERAGNFREVKMTFDEDTARVESRRCLTCGSRPVIAYPGDCMLCLYCERDCPTQAIYVAPERTEPHMMPWD
jgi:NADPH-dependent glutamate synthase beta subunit-like oxidoreductase